MESVLKRCVVGVGRATRFSRYRQIICNDLANKAKKAVADCGWRRITAGINSDARLNTGGTSCTFHLSIDTAAAIVAGTIDTTIPFGTIVCSCVALRQAPDVVIVVAFHPGHVRLKRLQVDVAHPPGDFFRTGDLESLTGLDRMHIAGRLEE